MGSYREYEYIEGNTARKLREVEEPRRERRAKRQPKIQYVTVVYLVFLTAAAGLLFWSCVNYLQLQAETTSRVKNIASLETELETLRKENDDNYTRIMTSVDLDYIRDVAMNELGMVYAQPDQVILYDGGTKDYVRQSWEIPTE